MIFFSGGSCCAISFHSFTFPWIFDDRWVSKMYLVSVRSASVSLGQKPHSLFAVHECGHVIANLSPCLCKLTSKPENGVQWVVSSNSSYASQLVKSDCFKIKSFKSLHKVDTKRRE